MNEQKDQQALQEKPLKLSVIEHPEQPTPYVYFLAFMACLNSTNLGYDVGSIGGSALLIKVDLGWNNTQVHDFCS